MIAMTAAEIAAAEAAAIAAAEAAAVHAAQVAAAQAAQVAAAEAATQAAAQAATQAATQQATTSGIQTLAQEVAASPPTGIETLNMAQAPVTGPAPTGIETLNMGQVPTANDQVLQVFQNAQANTPSMTGEQFLNNSFAGPAANTSYIPPSPTLYGSAQPPAPPSMGPNTFPDIVPQASALPTPPAAPPAAPSLGGPGTGYQGNAVQIGSGSDATPYTPAELQIMQGSVPSSGTPPTPEPNFLQSAFKDFTGMSLPNKFLTGMMGTTAYEMLNKPDPYEKEKYKSTFKPGLYTGYQPVQPTPYQPRYAVGGIADLGGYSDYARGGRLLKGPGDGMSDDIPATIANKQPARLANEEFVVPADVVSHLGNGSSEAGAKVLYKMMERVRKARTGNKKQGKQINPEKYLA
jgi:hypothetical protein